jgi:hypothetical protein
MLDLFVLVAALATAASPTPSPAPMQAPGGLREIAHVRSSAACAELAAHANSAIGAALRNDAMLAQTIRALRAVNLDSNPIARRNSLQQLGDFARDLNLQALNGDGEVKRLRAMAEKSTDPERKKELKAFADWLGGALWRQRKVARDLNGFLATMDFRDMAKLDESQQNMNISTFGSADPTVPFPGDAQPILNGTSGHGTGRYSGPILAPKAVQPSDTAQALAAAKDFELRLAEISNDEAMAADHVPGATSGC